MLIFVSAINTHAHAHTQSLICVLTYKKKKVNEFLKDVPVEKYKK